MRPYASRRYRLPEEEPELQPKAKQVDQGLARLSHYLDQVFRIPGTTIRFGLEPIIGLLLPGAGDALAAVMSAYIVMASVRYGLPKIVIGRMVFNVAVDYLLGSLPLIGDLFDFAFKANQKNLDLLDRHASGRHRPSFGDWAWLVVLLAILGTLIVGGVLLAITVLSSFRLF
ncbi:MAG: DUF4112 domain-containing protein [Acidobacteriota bacterium]